MKIFNGTHKTIVVISGKKSTIIPANYTISIRIPKGTQFNTSGFYVEGEGEYYAIPNKTPLQDIGIYINYTCAYCGKKISTNEFQRYPSKDSKVRECYCSTCYTLNSVEK